MRRHRQDPPQKKPKPKRDSEKDAAVKAGAKSVYDLAFTHHYGPQILLDHGPLLFADWDLPNPQRAILEPNVSEALKPVDGVILLDTGAVLTCIAEWAAQELGLLPIRIARGQGAGGEHENPVYVAKLSIPIINAESKKKTTLVWQIEAQGIPKMERTATHRSLRFNGAPCRLIGLLGRDVLRQFRFMYDGPTGAIRMALLDRGAGLSLLTEPAKAK